MKRIARSITEMKLPSAFVSRRGLVMLCGLVMAGMVAMQLSAQQPAPGDQAVVQNDPETPDDPPPEKKPTTPAKQSKPKEKKKEKKKADKPLPTLSEMKLPSMADLLSKPAVDWIVLNRKEEVIVARPVFPRPNTLEKMQAAIDALPRAITKDQQLARRKRVQKLSTLEISLPGEDDAVEYAIDIKEILQVIHHEDLLLRRVDKLLEEEKFRDAFEVLYLLERRHPTWPKLAETGHKLLFLQAAEHIEASRREAAWLYLEELHDREKKYPELFATLGKVADDLIAPAIEEEDYRKARHFLGRLRKREPKHPIGAKWQDDLTSRAAVVIKETRAATTAGRHDVATLKVDEAARIWPATPGLLELHRQTTSRFQTLHVGVLQQPDEKSAYFLPTAADIRHRRLTESPLFEVDRIDRTAHYRTRYFREWEPTQLGRQITFELRQRHRTWESHPIITAESIARVFSERMDRSNSLFDERLADYVESVRVISPFRFEIRFARVPLRPEPLLALAVAETARDTGKPVPGSDRFSVHERSADHIAYRRTVPEDNGLSQYHIAEIIEEKYASHDKAMQGLLRGEVSALLRVQPWDVAQLADDDGFVVRQYALPTTHVLQFNPNSKPLQNRQVRRALAFALDRSRILRETVLRSKVPTHGRLVASPVATRNYAYDSTLKPREYDLTRAISLRIAGQRALKGGLPTLKLVCSPDPLAQAAATQLIEFWKKAKIDVQLVTGGKPLDDWDLIYRTSRMEEPLVEIWPFLALDTQARIEAIRHLPDWLRQQVIDLEDVGDWKTAELKLQRLFRDIHDETYLIPLWEVDEFYVSRREFKLPSGGIERPAHAYDDVERAIFQFWYPTEGP